MRYVFSWNPFNACCVAKISLAQNHFFHSAQKSIDAMLNRCNLYFYTLLFTLLLLASFPSAMIKTHVLWHFLPPRSVHTYNTMNEIKRCGVENCSRYQSRLFSISYICIWGFMKLPNTIQNMSYFLALLLPRTFYSIQRLFTNC